MSDDGNESVTELEQLQEEFDSYKAKTKDWQGKVRERDIKMREQVKETTLRIQEQEEALEELNSKLLDATDGNKKLRNDLAASERKLDDSIRDATAKLRSQHERDLEDAQTKVQKLRNTVQTLEAEVTAERKATDGSAFFQQEGCTFKVLERVDTTASDSSMIRTFCLVQQLRDNARNSADETPLRWFELPTLRRLWDQWVHQELSLPPTAAELKATQLDIQREKIVAEHAEYLSALEAKHQSSIQAHEVQAGAEHEAVLNDLQQQIQQLHQTKQDSEAQWQALHEKSVRAHEQEMERLQVDSQHTLAQSLQDVKVQRDQQLVVQERKIRELEEYKVKAQAAMKKLQQSKTRTPPSAPLQLEAEPLSSCPPRPSSGSQTQLTVSHSIGTVTSRCTVVDELTSPGAVSKPLVEASPEFVIQRSPGEKERIVLQEENWALEAKIQKLTQALGEKSSTAKTAEVEQLKVRILELERNLVLAQSQHRHAASETQAQVISSAHVDPVISSGKEDLPHGLKKSTSVGSGSGAAGSGSDFNFDELLQRSEEAASLSRARVSVRRDRDAADVLRLQLAEERQKITQLRYELREATLLEEKHLAQEKLLKDQLREEERKAERTALQQEQADYVKNVVMQFITATNTNRELQKNLVPVIAQLLKLSNEEKATMEKSLQ